MIRPLGLDLSTRQQWLSPDRVMPLYHFRFWISLISQTLPLQVKVGDAFKDYREETRASCTSSPSLSLVSHRIGVFRCVSVVLERIRINFVFLRLRILPSLR
jgi:hypothetical protein